MTATSLQWPFFWSQQTVHTFALILTSLQRPPPHNSNYQPLKLVPTAKITFRQWTANLNQRLTNGIYKAPLFLS